MVETARTFFIEDLDRDFKRSALVFRTAISVNELLMGVKNEAERDKITEASSKAMTDKLDKLDKKYKPDKPDKPPKDDKPDKPLK